MTSVHGLTRNIANVSQVTALLTACDLDFSPPLSARLEIPTYAERICTQAERFEHWDQSTLVGLLAIYCVTPAGAPAFITNLSVCSDQRGRGLADALLRAALMHARSCGFAAVALEVDVNAHAARRLYAKHEFLLQSAKGGTLLLQVTL
ncbi:GNAT family N-acetyltransferase [Rhizobium sp. R86522]|uniref:GNAT family N-acetyltransferase n=1 Tax=Rhizobium sp. R86522 TaxID=3093861 RepID=UPI00366EEA5B